MITWCPMNGPFKSARVSEFSFIVLSYNIILSLVIQITWPAQMVNMQRDNAKGPGFDSQVPNFAFYYFVLHDQVHMYTI